MNKGSKIIAYKAFRMIFLVTISFCALFPIYWMLVMSFKPPMEWISTEVLWLPRNPTLLNWITLFVPESESYQKGMIADLISWRILVPQTAIKSIINSIFLSIGGTMLSMFMGTTVAYAMSRYNVGGELMPFLFLMIRMLPPVAILMPIVIWYSTLGLLDSYAGMILLYGFFTVPFVIWLMRSFFEDVPKDIDEAALIDGCSPLQVFYRVIFPLVRAGFVVTALFIFILNWSDFAIALAITFRSSITIPVKMGTYGYNWGVKSALGTFALIPTLAFGLSIQKYLVRGLTFGAIRGNAR